MIKKNYLKYRKCQVNWTVRVLSELGGIKMGQQVVKRKAKTQVEEGSTRIFKLPEGVNVVQVSKLSETIFVKNGVIEVDVTDIALLNHVKGIDGASDVTETIAMYRGE